MQAKELLRDTTMLLLASVATGISSAIFLISLKWAASNRGQTPWIIYLLPLAGLGVVFIYRKWGKDFRQGNSLLIKEAQSPKRKVSLLMAPMILITTVLSHIFGASVGREGTAVQFGGSFADGFLNCANSSSRKRSYFLMAGMSAGFSSVFGTPIAGAIFGIEITRRLKLNFKVLPICLLTAFIANYTALWLNAPHSQYIVSNWPPITFTTLGALLWTTILFALCSSCYAYLKNSIASAFQGSPYIKVTIASFVVVGFYLWSGSDRLLGLSVPVISQSFIQVQNVSDTLMKLVLTAVSAGSGFQGGEVTPLFMMGANLGSALSQWTHLSFDFLAAVGFVSVFAGAAGVPLTSAIMACELFGWEMAPFAIIACFLSQALTRRISIYPTT